MTVQWFVAKHIPDMRRREPLNVGVVVLADGAARARFLGEREDGEIDGRRTRWAGRADAYKPWVDYWRHQAAEAAAGRLASEELASALDPTASYVLESGGRALVQGRARSAEEWAEYLYAILVEEPEGERLSVRRLSESVLARAGIAESVQEDVMREVVVGDAKRGARDRLRFDYAYENGAVHLMQRVSLDHEDYRSWSRVHEVVYSFQSLRELDAQHAIALVKPRPEDRELRRQLDVLRSRAHVVSLADEAAAARSLQKILHLG